MLMRQNPDADKRCRATQSFCESPSTSWGNRRPVVDCTPDRWWRFFGIDLFGSCGIGHPWLSPQRPLASKDSRVGIADILDQAVKDRELPIANVEILADAFSVLLPLGLDRTPGLVRFFSSAAGA